MGIMLFHVRGLWALSIGITLCVMFLLIFVLDPESQLVRRWILGYMGDNDRSLRPADILLYSWDGGRDVCVDLTGSSPLTQSGMIDFTPGRAVIDAA